MEYELLLTPPGGGSPRDLSGLVQTLSWSGNVDQVARELTGTLCVPRDGSVEPPPWRRGPTSPFDGMARPGSPGRCSPPPPAPRTPWWTSPPWTVGGFW